MGLPIVAVAVAPEPPPPVIETVGVEVYQKPAFVTVRLPTGPLAANVAVPVAPEPPPPVMLTVGVEV